MNSEGNGRSSSQTEHDNLTLDDIYSSMRRMATLLHTLETKTNVLPKVDEKGDSECPFAEDLYAQKEEAAEKVREHLEVLRRLLELLAGEQTRLHANLDRVQADAGSLHLESAKEKYLTAQQGLEHNIKKNQENQNKLLDLISKAEEMLALALTKKWPLGKPEERIRFSSTPSGPVQGFRSEVASSAASPPGPSLGREVESLLSLGPVGEV
jgi:hypothetical protein